MITKEIFVEIISALEQQKIYDNQYVNKLSEVFPDAFPGGLIYNNSFIIDVLLKILKEQFNDNHKDSWIEYFIYELDYGRNNGENSAWDESNNVINLSSSEYLYDFLVRNQKK